MAHTTNEAPLTISPAAKTPFKFVSIVSKSVFTVPHFVTCDSYVSNKYGKQFSEFRGTKLKIQKSRDTGTKAGVLISSYLTVPGRDSIKVIWQVSDGSGFIKLIDIKVEGVSMLSTERQEIRSKLKKASGSINKLIIDMQREKS